MKTIVLLFCCLILLQGCVYPISKDLVEKTDRTITFEMLQADPNLYKGKVIILGGSIAAITGIVDGSLIDVYQTPLDYWGRPISTNKSRGQFLIYTPIYVDPDIYSPGSEITVAGETEGTTLKLPGNTELPKDTYPVLVSKELKLWPRKQGSEDPNWWDHLWDPLSPIYYPM